MTAKAVQISLGEDLLGRIDADPEVREKGRSAFIRSAVELYFRAKERRAVDARLTRAYKGEADVLLEEVDSLLRP
jgi:metal-responsive CopG/Arc/MetJ family transcriptional regulator